jgi:hypothetical protein
MTGGETGDEGGRLDLRGPSFRGGGRAGKRGARMPARRAWTRHGVPALSSSVARAMAAERLCFAASMSAGRSGSLAILFA